MRFTNSFWTERLHRVLAIPALERFAARIGAGPGQKGAVSSGAGRIAVSTFSIRVAGAALAYLSQIILARWMGAFDYGIYSVVWTLIIVLGAMACAGFSSSPGRFIPEYRHRGSLQKLRGFLVASRMIVFAFALTVAVLAGLLLSAFKGLIEPHYVGPLALSLVALPFLALSGVQDGIARSHDWPVLAVLPTFIWRPLAVLILLGGLVLAGQPATAQTAVMAALAATLAILVYQSLHLHARLRKTIPAGPRETEMKTWLAVSLPMLMVDGFMQLLTSADVLMVSLWHSPEDVAVYFAASKTLALVHFVFFAVRSASAHRFSALVQAKDPEALAAYARMATWWTFWPSLVAGLGLLALAPLLLRLFGADFTDGYPLIAILMIGVLARASVGPADALLSMSGHQRLSALVYGATFLVNIGLNVVLIPWLGLPGAALATSLAIIFEAACLAILAHRRLNVQLFVVPIRRLKKERS
ncbi:polysaccharide biosynthesis protein [Roseibium aquae]|uniref:Polysaccharide biosynthesis protein n=1 Tax=Roseibium aquae TaxID=1323746 RepID=A0A916WXP6_9HYPH|nr:lipopolysaccharide biosynthesis protein [Roseibium aquae]GGB38709.1 polysaccharide biosynthesis protein [Roseibium aquae]